MTGLAPELHPRRRSDMDLSLLPYLHRRYPMQDAGGNMQAPQCSTSVQVPSANNTPKPTNISHSVQADTRTSLGGVQGPGSK
ncbi:hypothetical protein JMJ77_0012836 [Colletotrichum scovillei]|uniref:Uncharacterized protein n=1 Tax=Colletotrichum scovillei TaxID=1209932 RepID=A0A9P7R4J1_9PEZI|nr:hypothetical protein JMJ77_0012836 [Colletotrichum scovillei]KAG7069119.1 hypothetical protein JMJ76_0002795 [Colletotrichum scovillei]KAG7073071.1 hypothetical protein JMJ78_0014052 [Colletotrichum scovillei]